VPVAGGQTVKSILCSVLVAVAAVAVATAQGTYTQVDVPGSDSTYCNGVNTAGDIVGSYSDPTTFTTRGFLLSRGVYTTIIYDVNDLQTSLDGVNDVGQIVGTGSQYTSVGFSYDIANQTFTTISYPGANSTSPLAINNSGTIVGGAFHGLSSSGVEFRGSKSRIISPPNTQSVLRGVTSSGEILGLIYNDTGSYHNVLFKHGKFTPLEIPNAPGAQPVAINATGTAVAGSYTPSSGVTAGFLYQNKTLTTLQFPGSNATYARGINAADEVVGLFIDANNRYHGFIWTPSSDAATK